MGQFLREYDDSIPNFFGIKFTSQNLEEGLDAVKARGGKFVVFLGADTVRLHFFKGVTYTHIPCYSLHFNHSDLFCVYFLIVLFINARSDFTFQTVICFILFCNNKISWKKMHQNKMGSPKYEKQINLVNIGLVQHWL